MNTRRSSLLRSISVALMAAGIMVSSSFAAAPATKGADAKLARRAATINYKLKANITDEQRNALAAVLVAHDIRMDRKSADDKTVRVKAARPTKDEETIAQQLVQTGAVEWAEPDYVVDAALTPNDPYFTSQWAHTAIASTGAWDISTGSTNILMAVCDTGVNSAHVDLANNVVLPGYNTYLNSTYTTDTVGHGTMVAGFADAQGNNGLGVAGVSWKVKVLPVRITYADGVGSAYLSDMAEGLMYAADKGAKVINCSFSGYQYDTIESAASYARGKGALVFFAAGNDGLDISTYRDSANIVVVGATTSTGTRASWSNYGTPIDLVAPGASVMSTDMNGGYSTGSGTSYASPIAAGLAALVFSINPALTPDQVEQILKSTCKDIGTAGEDSVYGFGLIQANAAATAAQQTLVVNPPPPGTVTVAAPTGLTAAIKAKTTVALAWMDNATNETGYYVERAPAATGVYARVATLAANAKSFSQNPGKGSYLYRVQAFNATAGVVSGYSNAVTVTIR